MSTKKLQIVGSLIETDDTLTQTGKPADAKATGDLISQMQVDIDNMINIDYDTYLAFDTTEIV